MASQTFSLATRIHVSLCNDSYGTVKQGKLTDRVKLNNGVLMPAIHLGVYLASGAEALQATQWALEVCPDPPSCSGLPE